MSARNRSVCVFVSSVLYFCVMLAGCAGTPEKKAAEPAGQPEQETQQKAAVPPPPENFVGSVDAVVKRIDTTYYEILRKATNALNAIDMYLLENDINLLLPTAQTKPLSKRYNESRKKFGRFFEIISDYSLYCDENIPDVTRSKRFVPEEKAEEIRRKLADIEKELTPFKTLPEELDTLFKKIKKL